MDDVRRLVRPAAHGLRGEVGRVRLGEDPLRRDLGRRLAQVGRLRIRDVAGERDVVVALERHLQELGAGEAVEDDGAAEVGQCGGRLDLGGSRVDDDRLL